MDKRNLNRNQNYRSNNNRNERRNDDSQKEKMKEQKEDFKEKNFKAKEPRSSHRVLEEVYFDAPNKIVKSLVVFDSSYLN